MPRVRANGIEIEYERLGAGRGPTVLLVMGLGLQLTSWDDRYCAAIVDAGYDVIRFDNRDAGLSTMFDAECPDPISLILRARAGGQVEPPYSLRDMAEDAVALLDELDVQSTHLVGASMGGMIAQRMAIHHPARVRSLTSIMSSTGNPDLPRTSPEIVSLFLLPTPDDEEAAVAHGVNRARRLFGSGFPFDEAEATARVRATRARSTNTSGTARQLLAIYSDGDRRADLRSIETPTLVVHGDDDPLVPIAGGRDTAQSVPGSRFVEIAGMGHAVPEGAWPSIFEAMCALWDTSAAEG